MSRTRRKSRRFGYIHETVTNPPINLPHPQPLLQPKLWRIVWRVLHSLYRYFNDFFVMPYWAHWVVGKILAVYILHSRKTYLWLWRLIKPLQTCKVACATTKNYNNNKEDVTSQHVTTHNTAVWPLVSLWQALNVHTRPHTTTPPLSSRHRLGRLQVRRRSKVSAAAVHEESHERR